MVRAVARPDQVGATIVSEGSSMLERSVARLAGAAAHPHRTPLDCADLKASLAGVGHHRLMTASTGR
jgi:hypothetical protein